MAQSVLLSCVTMSNRSLSRAKKLVTSWYKPYILSVLLYGAEVWIILRWDAAVLQVFGRKFLYKIFSPVCVGDDGSMRELSNISKDNGRVYVSNGEIISSLGVSDMQLIVFAHRIQFYPLWFFSSQSVH